MSLLSLKTELRQELKLTPQLLQSMEVLQMNSQELLDYLGRLSEENPTLELSDSADLRSAYESLRQRASWLDAGTFGSSFAHEEDGPPEPGAVARALESLSATFFLVGERLAGNEDLVLRMQREGHQIGNHTYSHVKLSGMAPEAACEEIRKTSDLIQEITGKPAEYIRPPFGEWDKSLECGLTLFPVLWTVDTLDWTTENVSDVVRRGTEKVKDGDVILLHDCYASSVKAALEIIDTLKSRGFQFVTADELILE